MNRRNARTQLTVLPSACLCLAILCLMPILWGGPSSVLGAEPEAPAPDVEIPTPSPSDAPPPAAEPAEEPTPLPPACGPVSVQPAPYAAVCYHQVACRCRPRLAFRRGLRRRVACCPGTAEAPQPAAAQAEADPWQSLFDGQSLKGWKATKFGGEGEVEVRDGMIVMDIGGDMTGITYDGEPPRTNYELRLEGRRLAGHDFFCTTTFPVGEEHCSLVVGGWGGTVVGLSNVDFYDASDNLTTNFKEFKNDTWYAIRIRVSDHKITAWIDDDKVVEQPRKGHKFDVRMEVDLSRPLGFSTWQTSGAVRNIRVRKLTDEEIAADVPN
ncbi:MAG: DUF1080 domain-containing protein [Thermoguttaceae bacterium]|nr:DUF1080 domain-containing protein [Thermoguttaceae bacterium]